jgi:hypothetical protein
MSRAAKWRALKSYSYKSEASSLSALTRTAWRENNRAREARFLCRDNIAIPLDADPPDAFASEIGVARERAAEPDVVVAIAGLDARNWKFVRVLLSEPEPDAGGARCRLPDRPSVASAARHAAAREAALSCSCEFGWNVACGGRQYCAKRGSLPAAPGVAPGASRFGWLWI